MRLNVWVPDELAERVREQLPGLNVSAALQASLRELLECEHASCRCVDCGAVVELEGVRRGARESFYRALMAAVVPVVRRVGTAEGAAKAMAEAGREAGVRAAEAPLVRPTRANREAAKDRAWAEAHGRRTA